MIAQMTGHMLHGVNYVEISGHLASDPAAKRIPTDGRVYMWSNGNITVYRENRPWTMYPAHRVLRIVGSEQG